MGLLAGNILPLQVQLFQNNLFVRARLFAPDLSELSSSPVSLPYNVTTGSYINNTVVMPNQVWVTAIYQVFNDAGFTSPSSLYGGASDTFYLDQGSGGGGGSTAPLGNQQTIVMIESFNTEIEMTTKVKQT